MDHTLGLCEDRVYHDGNIPHEYKQGQCHNWNPRPVPSTTESARPLDFVGRTPNEGLRFDPDEAVPAEQRDAAKQLRDWKASRGYIGWTDAMVLEFASQWKPAGIVSAEVIEKLDKIRWVLERAYEFAAKYPLQGEGSEADRNASAELYAYLEGAQENLYEVRQAIASSITKQLGAQSESDMGFYNFAFEVKCVLTEEFGEHHPDDLPRITRLLEITENILHSLNPEKHPRAAGESTAGTRKEPAKRTGCNRHSDCDAADKKWLAAHSGEKYVPMNFHCHDDECEDGFGC